MRRPVVLSVRVRMFAFVCVCSPVLASTLCSVSPCLFRALFCVLVDCNCLDETR
jgi:hypothetical protein